MNILSDITNVCKDLLNNYIISEHVQSYLNKRLSKSAQDIFNFGYFPDHDHLELLTSVVGETNLSDNGLLYQKIFNKAFETIIDKHAFLENHNVVMPYKDVYGNVVAIVGRTLLDDNERQVKNIPKYKNTVFNKSKHLFGLYECKNDIIKENAVFIVEGQFDCISAYDKGIKNVVALGSSNMSLDQIALISRYTENIYLMLDNDEAGMAGRDRAISKFSSFANIKNAYIPEGYKDIDEFLQENTPENLNYLIQ